MPSFDSSSSQFWRFVAGHAPVVRDWDGEYVVFAPLSGDTHLLDVVGGEVLTALQSGAVEARLIYQRVADLLELPADDMLAARVDAILDEFDRAGLIERVD